MSLTVLSGILHLITFLEFLFLVMIFRKWRKRLEHIDLFNIWELHEYSQLLLIDDMTHKKIS